MFTGIIEEIGIVKEFLPKNNGAELTVEALKVLEETKLGDSIAIDGVCQTVTAFNEKSFTVQVSEETLGVTTFKSLKSGAVVNLERALTLKNRLGGHVVSGHVDGTAKLVKIESNSDFHNLFFETDDELKKYLVKKGSVTVNGISLTVANIENNIFECAIIPHTFENTNLKSLKPGDFVNIEADIFAKYIEKFLLNDQTKKFINEDFLKEHGFI